MNNRVIINVKSLFYSVVLLLLIIQDVISHYISFINYYDEAIAIALFLIYIKHVYSKKRIKKQDIEIILLVIVLILVGLVGNSISNIQNNIKLLAFDAFNIFKFVIVILGGRVFFINCKNRGSIIMYTAFFVKCIAGLSSVFMILNLFFNIGMHTDYRYGIRAYNFIFTRVGDFYSSCILWIIVLTASLFYKKKFNTKFFIALSLVNMCATLRSRAWGFVLLYLILYYALLIKKEKTFKLWYSIPLALFINFIAADQFVYYFSGNRARNILLKYGILTAKNYFPFGSGFATYGTAIAQKNYSALYHTYNFSAYWGLSPQYGSFLTDNYWPAVMAEFGFPGAVLMAFLIYKVIKKLILLTDNPYSKSCVCFGFGTLLLSSLASSSFFACIALVVFMCLTCELNQKSRRKMM